MSVMDPTAKPTFSIYSTNYSAVKVRLYAVQPTDWYQYQQYVRQINYDDDAKRPMIPGRLVYDETVSIKNVPDELVETRIDVGKALNNGFGNVIVDIEPTVKKDKYDRTRVFTWLQATQIGLDAFVDNQELVGFAPNLHPANRSAASNCRSIRTESRQRFDRESRARSCRTSMELADKLGQRPAQTDRDCQHRRLADAVR